MTRLMYDALQASGIPQGAEMAAWYPYDSRSDGAPKGAKQVLTIDNSPDAAHPDCDILDCEPGACWDGTAITRWLTSKANSDDPGTLYFSLANEQQVKTWVDQRFSWLVADWTGVAEDIVPGSIGMQFKAVGAYDLSLIVDDAWHPAGSGDGTPPPPPPWPTPAGLSVAERFTVTASWEAVTPTEETPHPAYMVEVQTDAGQPVGEPTDTDATSVEITLPGHGSYQVRVQTHISRDRDWSPFTPWQAVTV